MMNFTRCCISMILVIALLQHVRTQQPVCGSPCRGKCFDKNCSFCGSFHVPGEVFINRCKPGPDCGETCNPKDPIPCYSCDCVPYPGSSFYVCGHKNVNTCGHNCTSDSSCHASGSSCSKCFLVPGNIHKKCYPRECGMTCTSSRDCEASTQCGSCLPHKKQCSPCGTECVSDKECAQDSYCSACIKRPSIGPGTYCGRKPE
eukprot:m.39147 g.39147  ORF g.39147 m.39147 type:complete len:202 (-) comp9514_c0_seq1:43-648(-)